MMDTSSSLGRAEMLRVVEAVAQEKGISTDEVLEAYIAQVNPAVLNARLDEVKTICAQLRETMAAEQASAAPVGATLQPGSGSVEENAPAPPPPVITPPIPGSAPLGGTETPAAEAPAPTIESETITPPVGEA